MKRVFSIVGIIAGVFLIFIGILSMCGVLGDASYSGSNSWYSSGFASFGGDYYTYSVNNAAEAASAARAAANNLREISEFLQLCYGLALIAFGVIDICGFGIVYANYPKLPKADEKNEEVSEVETVQNNNFEINE